MPEFYTLQWLDPADWAQAYPLVRMAFGGISLADWRKRARQLTRPGPARGGLMVVRDLRGTIHGLLAYRMESNFAGQRILRISDLVLARLPGAALDEAVLQGISELFRDHQCAALVLDLPANGRHQPALSSKLLDQYEFVLRGIVYGRTHAPA